MAELDFSKYEDLQACIEESRISITKDYIKSPEVLMVGDSTFGTLGNFSVSIGKAKSKKTFNVSAIVAAALSNGSVLHYNAKFPEDKRFVLYIRYRARTTPLSKGTQQNYPTNGTFARFRPGEPFEVGSTQVLP